MATSWPKKRRIIGTKVPRIDGPAKSTGFAKYSYDINRPGMLHAVMLRCPYAHARITKLDTAIALKMPGVKGIATVGTQSAATVTEVKGGAVSVTVRRGAENVTREIKAGPGVFLTRDGLSVSVADLKVGDKIQMDIEQDAVNRELFYAGDEVLALCADTEEHAWDALRAIKIDYTQLESFVKEEDALKAGTKKTVGGVGTANTIPGGKEYTKGDVDKAFNEAAAVVTGTYGAAVICHQCLEPHGLVAEWGADGSLTVWASTQATVSTAQALAAYFSIPPTKVKCITHHMGGGYGAKFGPDVQGILAAVLAKRANAAVKLMLDRESEIISAGNRPSVYGTVKIAGDKAGKITAFEVDCYGTSGYTGGATVNLGLLPYVYTDSVPNIKRKHSVVRVNAGGARAMRAPGHPQNCILTEFAVDDLAAKLGIDPMQMRLANLPANDSAVAAKAPHSYFAMRQTLYTQQIKMAAAKIDWAKKWHAPGKGPGAGPIKHGLGMALHTWGGFASGGAPNEATVIISRDGTVTVESSTQDLGTAQRTVSAIIPAEILGLSVEQIVVKIGESNLGFSSGSGGSTTLPSQAPATLRAADAARDDLFAKVGPKVGADPKNLQIAVGKVVDTSNKKEWSWKEFCARLGMEEAKGRGNWNQDQSNDPANAGISSGQVGGCQMAEVMVDTETGVVRIVHMAAVQDCGLLINKLACESQVAGGVIMGINYALFEERIMDRTTGRQVNPDMEFYKLGGLRDMPKISVEMMDMPERGVIGIGEPPTISTAAAIGNAVFNALGVRVPMLPLTPQRVLEALAKKA